MFNFSTVVPLEFIQNRFLLLNIVLLILIIPDLSLIPRAETDQYFYYFINLMII